MNDLQDENTAPVAAGASSPSGTPADSGELDGADELRGIEKALTGLADEHKKAAERHLIRAALGLIIGFFTALLLPVGFTLIDAYVERQLTDLRSQGAADQVRVDNNVADEFAKVRQQSARYQNDKQEILRSAYDSHFGSVVFRDYPYIQENLSVPLGFRGQQTINCPGIEGDVALWDRPVSGHYAGLIGTGADNRRYRGQPALVYMDKTARTCTAVALRIPEIPTREGTSYRLDSENLSLTPNAGGLVIPLLLTPAAGGADLLIGVLACNLEEETTPADPQCALVETPENLRQAEISRIVMNEIATGFGLLVGLRSGGTTLLSLDLARGKPEQGDPGREPGLSDLSLRAQPLSLDSGVNQIIVRGEDAFLLGSAYEGPVPVVRLRAAQDFDEAPGVQDGGSIFVGDSSGRIVDLDQWSGKTLALVTRQNQDVALALSGSNRLIQLHSVSSAEGTGELNELHVLPGDGGKTYLLLQRSRGPYSPPVLIGQQAPRSYAADIEQVVRLFEGTDLLSSVPEPVETAVFAAQQPWEGRNVLIPANDRALVERARAIRPVLDAFEAAETSFGTIQENLNSLRRTLADAQQSLKDTESDIAFWTTIAARIVIIALIFYFVQLEMSLNRYNSRLSGHYRARALGVRYLLSTGRDARSISFEDLFAAIVAIDSKEISGKEPPGPPTDKLITFLQNALKSREKPE